MESRTEMSKVERIGSNIDMRNIIYKQLELNYCMNMITCAHRQD